MIVISIIIIIIITSIVKWYYFNLFIKQFYRIMSLLFIFKDDEQVIFMADTCGWDSLPVRFMMCATALNIIPSNLPYLSRDHFYQFNISDIFEQKSHYQKFAVVYIWKIYSFNDFLEKVHRWNVLRRLVLLPALVA